MKELGSSFPLSSILGDKFTNVLPNTLGFITIGTALNKMYKTCKIFKFRTCSRTAQTISSH